jgi:hypothetical protein
LGTVLQSSLLDWSESLADPTGAMASCLLIVASQMFLIEIALLNLLGVALIGAGGWLERECRARWAQPRAAYTSSSDPARP